MATSVRNAARKVWPFELPNYNEEMLARLLYCFVNDPKTNRQITGAQNAIGICMSGLTRHFYKGQHWPAKIESCHDEQTLSWLENHLCLVEMFPRRPDYSAYEGRDVTPEKVRALTGASERCWEAIMSRDLQEFSKAFQDSFDAQLAMFPAMMQPGVREYIDRWRDKALAWKLSGSGGGGYLVLVVNEIPEGAIRIKIRRRNM